VERGEVRWAELPKPRGSEPGYRRPVLIVQADAFNRSRLRTVVALTLTTNMRLLDAPGNVLIRASESGLPKDSVANVSQVVTLDRSILEERAGKLGGRLLAKIDDGLRLVLSLDGGKRAPPGK